MNEADTITLLWMSSSLVISERFITVFLFGETNICYEALVAELLFIPGAIYILILGVDSRFSRPDVLTPF